MKPVNVTSSLYKDEKTLIEDELQNNQTSVIMEDDGEFLLILHDERKPPRPYQSFYISCALLSAY